MEADTSETANRTLDRLSTSEIDVAVKQLSEADWARIRKWATWRARNLPDWTPEDLVQEALVKVWSGERVWKRDVRSVIVLGNIIRGISSNVRKNLASTAINPYVQVESHDATKDSEDLREFVEPVCDVTPLDVMERRSELDEIAKSLEGDEPVELVAMAWAEGMRGQEAAEATGLDKKAYDAARKRLSR